MIAVTEFESDRSDLDHVPNITDRSITPQPRRCLVLGRGSGLVKQILSELGLHCTEGRVSWRILWSPRGVPVTLYKQLAVHQIVNRLPGSQTLTRKDTLVINIRRMAKRFGHFHFGSLIPRTFLLPTESETLQDVMAIKPDSLWIVKPSAGSQGTDIRVIRSRKKLLLRNSAIVSRYIRPYLIDGIKFDLRLYVVVTSIEPLRVYWHQEGLMRFATEPYSASPDHLSNRFIHLTNVAINRYHTSYDDVSENGHKRRLCRLWEHLGLERSDRVKAAIEVLVAKTVISAHAVLSAAIHHHVPNKRAGQLFELFGFDVILDQRLHPWLLEVNRSPTLTGASLLDTEIKAAMLTDLFALVGVKSAARPSSAAATRKSIIVDTDAEFERRGRWCRIYPRHEPLSRLALAQFFEERETRAMAAMLCSRIPSPPSRLLFIEEREEIIASSLLSERNDLKLLKHMRHKFGMHYASCKTNR